MSGVQVIPEARLWTGSRFDDNVTKLVLILGDASMEHIVLPVAVEDFVQGEARAVERELLEPGDVYPAGELLNRCVRCVVGSSTHGGGKEPRH